MSVAQPEARARDDDEDLISRARSGADAVLRGIERMLEELREQGRDNEHFEGELAVESDQDDDAAPTVVEIRGRTRGGDGR